MTNFQQRAGTLALPENLPATHSTTPSTLGERIVQAARMAVAEHLRQNADREACQLPQLPTVMGGIYNANGNQSFEYPGHSEQAKLEAA